MARPVLEITELAQNALHGEEQSRSEPDHSELEPAVEQRCGLPREMQCERACRVPEAQCLEGVEHHRHVGERVVVVLMEEDSFYSELCSGCV